MTKAELVEEVAQTTQLTKKHAEIIVNTVFDSIVDSLKTGEKIELRGFGSFRIRHRGARTGRNPKTGDKVDVPPKRIPYFKPGKELQGAAQRRVLERPALLRRPGWNSSSLPGGTRYITESPAADSGCFFCAAGGGIRTIRTAWWCTPAGITW